MVIAQMSDENPRADPTIRMSGEHSQDGASEILDNTSGDTTAKASNQDDHSLSTKEGEITETIGDIFQAPADSVIIR